MINYNLNQNLSFHFVHEPQCLAFEETMTHFLTFCVDSKKTRGAPDYEGADRTDSSWMSTISDKLGNLYDKKQNFCSKTVKNFHFIVARNFNPNNFIFRKFQTEFSRRIP